MSIFHAVDIAMVKFGTSASIKAWIRTCYSLRNVALHSLSFPRSKTGKMDNKPSPQVAAILPDFKGSGLASMWYARSNGVCMQHLKFKNSHCTLKQSGITCEAISDLLDKRC